MFHFKIVINYIGYSYNFLKAQQRTQSIQLSTLLFYFSFFYNGSISLLHLPFQHQQKVEYDNRYSMKTKKIQQERFLHSSFIIAHCTSCPFSVQYNTPIWSKYLTCHVLNPAHKAFLGRITCLLNGENVYSGKKTLILGTC